MVETGSKTARQDDPRARPGLTPPTVSVVLCTEGDLSALALSVESAREQSIRSLEILIADSSHTGRAREWLGQMRVRDRRLRVFRVPGVTTTIARNLLIKKAEAPLLAFLEEGAEWHRDKLSQQLTWHERHPSAAMSFSDVRYVDLNGEVTKHGFEDKRWLLHGLERRPRFQVLARAQARLFVDPGISLSTVMARTDLMRTARGFDALLPNAAEWDGWLKLAALGDVGCSAAALVDAPARVQRPPTMGDLRAMMTVMARYKLQVGRKDRGAIRRSRARLALEEAAYLRATNRHPLARRAIVQAFWFDPSAVGLQQVVRALIGRDEPDRSARDKDESSRFQ